MEVVELEGDLTAFEISGNEYDWINKMLLFSEHYPEVTRIEHFEDGSIIAVIPSKCLEIVAPENLQEGGTL